MQARTEQAHAHAVGPRIDLPDAVEGIEQALPGEVGDLRAQHGFQRPRRAQVGDSMRLQLPRLRRSAGPGQPIPHSQRQPRAVETTQAFPADGGLAAHDRRCIETTRGRQVGACTPDRLAEDQPLATAHEETSPGLQRLAVETGIEVGPRQGQAYILPGDQFQAAEGDLDHRRLQRIAQQPVGPGHRDPIGGAALGHAKLANAEAASVLQQRQGGTAFYPQATHGNASNGVSSPPRRMNSSWQTASKRTRSPGCSRL